MMLLVHENNRMYGFEEVLAEGGDIFKSYKHMSLYAEMSEKKKPERHFAQKFGVEFEHVELALKSHNCLHACNGSCSDIFLV